MYAVVRSASLHGVVGRALDVEVHVGVGLPGFTIVGQPDETCRESRDRVRAACLSRDLSWPNRRITVNLAPTAERKDGSALDLAIAVGVLVADEQVSPNSDSTDRCAPLPERCRSPSPCAIVRWSSHRAMQPRCARRA
jgi:magnesium chelatase family protein